MAGKHEWTETVPENNTQLQAPRLEISRITTGYEKSLREEITRLRLERDAYRVKYGQARTDVASLQARLDEAKDQAADLKRDLQRALKAGQIDLPQSRPQVMLRQACVHR
jgi:chromosome segregation ATPase